MYPQWAKAWGEGMNYEGEWKEGEHISFFDASGNGTKVHIDEMVIPAHIKTTHIAMVGLGNVEIAELDETMKKWIGSKEEYYLSETDGVTDIKIVLEVDEMFEEMMNAWPKALQYLKELCEAS